MAILASALSALAFMAACQAGPGAQESYAQGTRARAPQLKPITRTQDCPNPALVNPANARSVIGLCSSWIGSEQERDLSPDRFATLRLNLGRAHVAAEPKDVERARRLLEEAVDDRVRQNTLQDINRALADVYIASGTEADLDRALQKLGENNDIDSVRRRSDILSLKGASDTVRIETLRTWQQAATLYESLARGEAARTNTPAARADVDRAVDQVTRSSQRLGDFYLKVAEDQAPLAAEVASAREVAVNALREAIRTLAASSSPQVRARRGKAQLQLAGYLGPAQRGDFRCEPGRAERGNLEEARLMLIGVNTPEGKALLGCTLQAQGDPRQAIQLLRDAATSAPTGSLQAAEFYVMLGNAQRAAGAAGGVGDPNRADAVRSYEAALKAYEDAPANATEADRAQRRIQLAQTQFALGELRSLPGASQTDLNAAQCHYVKAIQQDQSFAAAHLEYGKYLYSRARREGPQARVNATCEGAPAVNGDNLSLAVSALKQAETIAGQADNRAVRNEAQYYQARALTEFHRSQSDLSVALDLSRKASDAAPGEWRFREQHCKTRVALGAGFLRSDDARPYCANATVETPESYALQGIYHLRRAQSFARLTPDALDELADAEASFQRGLNALEREGAAGRLADERAVILAKLRIGRGTAKFCTNQKETGDQEIAQARRDDSRAADLALTELDVYRVRSCDGSKVD
jgi:hypothetical protein